MPRSGITIGSRDTKAAPVYRLPKTFTPEQQAIIQSDAPIIFGQALAGTGKSTTAIGFVAHRPDRKALVLCFNHANAKEAKEKYPGVCSNATVHTVHALAYEHLDPELRPRVAQRWSPMSVRTDLGHMGIRPDMRTASIAYRILIDYFNTADAEIDPMRHSKGAIEHYKATGTEINRAARMAKTLWAAMQSKTPISGMQAKVNPVAIPHDAYLKIFSLKKEKLPFDLIVLDEAQDANAIMLDIMLQQQKYGTQLLFLGDTHQSIYDFRGAVNAMDKRNMPIEPAIFPLTQSWRMGPRSASVANLLLKELKGDSLRIDARGNDAPNFDESAPRTFLARTNATLLERAAALRGRGIHWVGGIGGYRVSMLHDVWRLRNNEMGAIEDYVIKNNFRTYDDFEEAALYDSEMGLIKKLVETYESDIPALVADLHKNAVEEADDATLILSTAHKAKGLEWDYVEIADDFKGALSKAETWLKGEHENFPEQEVNLLYVCYTRAKKAIKLNRQTYDWLLGLDVHRRERIRSWSGEEQSQGETQSSAAPRRLSRTNRNVFSSLSSFRPS